jgi:ABC-type amino acid transport substrate-binding protein
VRINVFILLTLFCITASSKQIEETNPLIFVVNAPGSPPYLYHDLDSQSYQGLVVDFFSQMKEKDIPIAKFIDSNRGRSEKFIIDGIADMMLTSSSWLENPEKLIISDKLSVHESYLYSFSPFEAGFTLQSIKNKRICARRGFIYPGLHSYFANNHLVRVDSSSQETMARMLKKDRCDYAVMNNHNAVAIFADQAFCQSTIFQSPTPTNTVDLSFVMGTKMLPLKALINKQIKLFIESGRLNASLLKHSSDLTFPNALACKSLEH